nr:ImmA/IrrE family metallo-endopeptidase [Frondihabitans sp. VKM Ac-2883]
MRAVHDRSALAHGLAHAVLGHTDDRPKHEVQADRMAAANLIDLDECRELMKWTPDCHRLARELGVTTRLTRVFLNVNHLAG